MNTMPPSLGFQTSSAGVIPPGPTKEQGRELLNLKAIDWPSVFERLADVWDALSTKVVAQWPWIQSRRERNWVEGIAYIADYCDFEVPTDHAIDPLSAFVSFTPTVAGDTIEVHSGMCGESSGNRWFRGPTILVHNTTEDVVRVAVELAEELAQHTDIIIEGLQQPTYPPES